MLERFTRERQRAAKGSAFNLDDEDELTHYGQSLSKLDDFDASGMQLDDDDDEEEGGRGKSCQYAFYRMCRLTSYCRPDRPRHREEGSLRWLR